jgi:glycosyltransferase involved in cell wall biosynthesis
MPANVIRGIGRWSEQFVLGLARHNRDLLAAVSIDDRLPIPAVVHQLPEDVPVVVAEERPAIGDSERLVFHQLSVFEDMDLTRLWPSWARHPHVALAVNVHDMIPALFPNDYFQGRLRYLLESRFRMVEFADVVITDSEATAADVVRLLAVKKEATFVAPVQVPSHFAPYPEGPAAAHRLLDLAVEPNFILSVGNVDPRKNLFALLRAYACLPQTLRDRHQLVITSSQASPDELRPLRIHAENLGVHDRVVLTSFVDDDTMLRLYQACYALVYPSHYEGLGLPVIEAMRCGAPTLVSDIPAFRNLVHNPSARFRPDQVADMSIKLQQLLEDPDLAARRRAESVSDSVALTWETSCQPIIEAYHRAAARRP